jgi:single-strand DNA-binding protein
MTTTTAPTTTAGFVGNMTDDPELRFSQAGKPYATFKLAVKPYVLGASEQPEPVYYSVVCFGSLAENVCETCRKGSRVVVTGRLEEDTWTGRDGNERVTMKVIADGIGPDLRFAGSTSQRQDKVLQPRSSTRAEELLGLGPTSAGSEMEPF